MVIFTFNQDVVRVIAAAANDIDGAQGRENGLAEPFNDGEIGDSDGLRIAGAFRLTHSGPFEHLPHDEGVVDPAVAAGDAGAAAYASAINRDQFGKVMLEHKPGLLVPPEGGNFRLKAPAKVGVGNVAEQIVNQRHGLGPSEWGKPVSSLYAAARMIGHHGASAHGFPVRESTLWCIRYAIVHQNREFA